MDAAAHVTEAAASLQEVVADLVDLLDSLFDVTLVDAAALVAVAAALGAEEGGAPLRLVERVELRLAVLVPLVVGASAAACFLLFADAMIALKLFGCILIGLASGISIGAFTEYCTSYTETPTQNITKSGKTGPATVVIQGLGVGMIGTAVPTVIIVIADRKSVV